MIAHSLKALYPNLPKRFPGIRKNSGNCKETVRDKVNFK